MLPGTLDAAAVGAQAPYGISVCSDETQQDRALAADLAEGLTSVPKDLPPKWFYDDEGSRLFAEITRLAEYYPTRREHEILQRAAADIVRLSGADTLVELGSGFSPKTRLLLDAMQAAGTLTRFVPFDVSEAALRATAAGAAAAYPGVCVSGVVGEFDHHLRALPSAGRRLLAFLGGTIGNFTPPARRAFLAEIADLSAVGETFLLGADLVKDRSRLLAAYDDAAGVTAAFNRNVLRVVNRRLGADFVPERFAHTVTYDDETRWIEMWLRSEGAQVVHVPRLGLRVEFADGETMRTEVSAKFRPAEITADLASAGFEVLAQWLDDDGDFSVTLARRVAGSQP